MGSYVGNGGALQLSVPSYARYVIIQNVSIENNIGSREETAVAFFARGYETFVCAPYYYSTDVYECNFQEGLLYVAASSPNPNKNGKTYYYIALG